MDQKTRELEELLVQQHYGLAVSQALLFCSRGNCLEDCIQVGLMGLLKAIRNYDPEKSKFSTFATICIKNEILRIKNKNKKHGKCTNIIGDIEYYGETKIWEILPDNLDEEEHAVLKLMQANFTKREICETLNCTKRSLDQQIKELIKKLKYHNGA